MSKKVLIGPSSFGEVSSKPLKKLVEAGFEVVNNPFKRKLSKKEVIELLKDKEIIGLLAGLETLDDEVLSSSNLRIISRVGSGTSNVDKQAIDKNKIKLYSVPNGPVSSVAELTIGNIINLFRKIIPMNTSLHSDNWKRQIGREINGKSFLIIGLGRIGKKVADLLKTLGGKVYVYDPFINQKEFIDQYNFIDLYQGLSLADLITIHVSGEECIISNKEFSNMKQGVLICNASRGGVIDENELINAINNNIVAGAWIDAFVEEPYHGKMKDLKQIILTPHVGSYTIECRQNMEMEAVLNLIRNI